MAEDNNEKLVARATVKTEGFNKTVVFMMALAEQIYEISSRHKSFRMELFYDEEALNVQYSFFAPNGEALQLSQPEPVSD